MSSFVGVSVTPDRVAVLECEPGAQLMMTNACLLAIPKKSNSRICLNVFSPDDEGSAKSVAVFSANGVQTCTLRMMFTSKIGFRLVGSKVDGAVVHVVGCKLEPGFQFRGEQESSDEDEVMEEVESKNGKGRKLENDDIVESPSKRIKIANDEPKEKGMKEKGDTKKEKNLINVEKKKETQDSKTKKKDKKKSKEGAEKTVTQESDDEEMEDAVEKEARNRLAEPVKKKTEAPKRKDVKTLKSGLKIRDVMVGTGKQVKKGRNVAVKYTLTLKNGKVVDKSGKKPFKFRLGVGDCIQGFDLGVAGMREGGERIVEVPSDLGYGKSGAPPGIAPNTDLIFEVQLTKAW